MQTFEPGQLGKLLILSGVVLIVAGGLVMGLSKLGLFRLPGDMSFGGKNWRVYFPLASCVVLSLVMTLIFWLVRYFRK